VEACWSEMGTATALSVYDSQTVLVVFHQRQLHQVDVDVIEAAVWSVEVAQSCAIMPVDLGALARFASLGPAGNVSAHLGPYKFFKDETHSCSDAGVREIVKNLEGGFTKALWQYLPDIDLTFPVEMSQRML